MTFFENLHTVIKSYVFSCINTLNFLILFHSFIHPLYCYFQYNGNMELLWDFQNYGSMGKYYLYCILICVYVCLWLTSMYTYLFFSVNKRPLPISVSKLTGIISTWAMANANSLIHWFIDSINSWSPDVTTFNPQLCTSQKSPTPLNSPTKFSH